MKLRALRLLLWNYARELNVKVNARVTKDTPFTVFALDDLEHSLSRAWSPIAFNRIALDVNQCAKTRARKDA
ncbi:MAG: hypothetical protein LIP02_12560 [Bacteroidales bacterium]|nr:hypothetical protein [Bacteroidales bacterium]